MKQELARTVRERASGRWEYCRIPQFAFPLPFQIDHIVAQQHGGETFPGNLALACPHCNRYKGPNIAGMIPDLVNSSDCFILGRTAGQSIFNSMALVSKGEPWSAG